MTQNSSETQPEAYSHEEVKAAESTEQKALHDSQNKYLTQRVVVLRAQLNRANRQLTEALARVSILEDMLPKDVEPGQGDDGPEEGSTEEHPSDD